jgi:hypothetical protein
MHMLNFFRYQAILGQKLSSHLSSLAKLQNHWIEFPTTNKKHRAWGTTDQMLRCSIEVYLHLNHDHQRVERHIQKTHKFSTR